MDAIAANSTTSPDRRGRAVKTLAPGTRIRTKERLIGGWIGKGTVKACTDDLVSFYRDGFSSYEECIVNRKDIAVLRKKPNAKLVSALAEIERLKTTCHEYTEALRSSPTLHDRYVMAAIKGLLSGKYFALRETRGLVSRARQIADCAMAERNA